MDDWQLLKDYVTKSSEEAFRALVERYAGMVYHAALRQTCNPHAAEEVAQVVFIALARKADGIPRQATLYGWLFRATRFAVLNQVRQNAHRERREQEALVMQPTIEPHEADSIWERITPHLNDALDRLSAADQELVMMRFFDNKSHKDVANALGVSEQTARKRISRAIERLREIFARRGVVVSSLALGSAFAAHGTQVVPMEVAASWAKVAIAKAAAGTAATSGAGGMLTLLTSAKAASLIAAVTGLMVLAAAFTVSRSVSHGSPVAQALAADLTNSPATPDTNKSLTGPVASTKSARDAGTTDPLAAALDKVKAALHDPNETALYPNSAMQDAIAGLGDKKKEALPLLEAALNDANAEVRLRATDGLGIIGPEAKEAAPLLLGVLRAGGLGEAIPQTRFSKRMGELGRVASFNIYTDTMLLYALGQVHPAAEILPEFARMLKEDRSVCEIVYRATRQFPGVRRSMQAGGWLWAIADENSEALNAAFRPLLQDPDRVVRRSAALSLVSALGDQADAGVFSVAIELLQSGNDNILRVDAMSLLEGAARDPRPDASAGEPSLTAARLGPFLNETVSALTDVAAHSTREDLRLHAAKMLDALSPDFRKSNPALAAGLEQQDQSDAFISKVGSGEATMTEVLEGLKRFPKAAPAIAGYYGRSGSNAVDLLPAFTEALSALAPSPEASLGDRTKAINARQLLADSMQKIAPELPKPIFTSMDTVAIRRTMRDPVVQADPERLQKVSDACQLAEWPDRGIFDVRPDAIRRLLAAMKDADAPTYDALVAKVKEIDPHFSDIAVGSGKESRH
jgi:RNA polymerase sigma factor (sigma-70 family)